MAGKLRQKAMAGWRTRFLGCALSSLAVLSAHGATIPVTQATALNDQAVSLPKDLAKVPVTVLILGFGRQSKDATTAWEKPVRLQLARPGQVGFYDMAMLAEVPGFVRPMVLRSVRHAVPDVLKPNFLPLTTDEAAWKEAAGYADAAPQAAYIMVVDSQGVVHWSSHEPYSDAGWRALNSAVEQLLKARS